MMAEELLSGGVVGLCAISIVTAIFYPLQIRAKKKSAQALFRMFTFGALLRLLFLVGIMIWGFKVSPLAGLSAIFSFGIFFLIFSLVENYKLKLVSRG